MAKESTSKEEFVYNIIEFYQKFIAGAIESIRKLADIQKNFPGDYALLQELQNNPSKIIELSELLNDEVKAILFDTFMRANMLQKKTAKLFELNSEQQVKLAEDYENFSKLITESLKKLKVIKSKPKE